MRAPVQPEFSSRTLYPAVAALLLVLPGCGKRGQPLPPLQHVPRPVTELSVIQRGANVIVTFKAPRTYSDGAPLPLHTVELLYGREDEDLEEDDGTPYQELRVAPGEAFAHRQPAPAAGSVLRVVARARAGRRTSSLVRAEPLTVAAPPEPPSDLTAESVPRGVRVAWSARTLEPGAESPAYHVYRRAVPGAYGAPSTGTACTPRASTIRPPRRVSAGATQ